MEEEKFNQNISNIFRNILTLRYDPTQETNLPILTSKNFSSSNTLDIDLIENLLTKSIKSNLETTKNISISLSGGVDSTLVLGLIRKVFPNISINAISIKFANSIDETPTAKNISEFFNADHQVIFLENYLLELPKAISIIGLPFWDIHWYYIAKHAKEQSQFIATGDGGDELFGGYTFRYSKFLSLVSENSSPLERIQAYLNCHIRDWVPDQEQIFTKKTDFSWDRIYSMFFPFFDNNLSPLNQVFLADYNGKLLYNFSIISKKINQFFNLNTISPILDDKLISYSSHLPLESKYDLNTTVGKIPLRKLLSKYQCDSLVSQQKLGFSVNTANLWNSIGKELCELYLENGKIVNDGWINKEWISSNLSKSDLDIRYINKFLGLLAFEIWYRIFITKEMNENTKLS